MSRYLTFLTRAYRARQFGVKFRGMSRTTMPQSIRFGGKVRQPRWSDDDLLVADFVNVALDDDYGLRGLKPAPRRIVDIGANIGTFSNWARDCFPDAVIHAYEPAPTTAALARHNTEHPLTTVFEEGVASADGRAEMVDLGASNLARTVVSEDGGIALTSFEKVVERIGGQIDLLKVDCEGAEWDFMRNTEAMKKVARIRMEYHLTDGRTVADVHQMARDLGFVVTRLVQNDGFGIVWMDPA